MKPYPRAKGEKRFGKFSSIVDANAQAEKIRVRIEAGEFDVVQRMTRSRGRLVSTLIEGYLEKIEEKPSYVAERGYGRWWSAHYHELRDVDVTPEILLEALDTLGETDFADQTILHYMKFLRRILTIECDSNRLHYNPFRHPDVRRHLPKPTAGPAQYFNDADETALTAALGPKYGKWFRFAIVTGLRKSEQFTLEWTLVDLSIGVAYLRSSKKSKLKRETGALEPVHLNDEAIEILRSLDSWQRSKWVFPAEGHQWMVPPKERELMCRHIAELRPRSPERRTALREYAAHYQVSERWISYLLNETPTNNAPPDVPTCPRSFYSRIWIPATKTAKLDGAKWHTCRHTFASRLAMDGRDPFWIAKALRHSSMEMVEKRYAHLNRSHMRAMLNGLSTFKEAKEGER
jgi:integrase